MSNVLISCSGSEASVCLLSFSSIDCNDLF
jgi:hypothetical protein